MTKAKNPQPPAHSSSRNIPVNASDNADLTGAASGPVNVTDRVKTRSMTRKTDASLTYGASVQTAAIKRQEAKRKKLMSKYAARDEYDVRLMAQGFLPRHLWSTFRGKTTKRS